MKKTVIIGGVAGGASCAARLRRLDENREIILLERGKYISYANCGLPYHVGNVIKSGRALLLQTPELMKSRYNIDVRVENEVLTIQTESRTVSILNKKTGEVYTEAYDDLVLATGSSPVRLPLPGADCGKVFSLWTVDDAITIRKAMKQSTLKSAVVIGGGFIGLEIAENLCHEGFEVHLVEMRNQVFPPFDREMAGVLHTYMREQRIELHLSETVTCFEDMGDWVDVYLGSGGRIACGFVVMCAGIKPNNELAKTAGIAVNDCGGIVVDKYLETSAKHVYAVGDVIADEGSEERPIMPLAAPANKQGRIAADNIMGLGKTYEGARASSVVKLFGYTLAATGVNEKILQAKGLVKDRDYRSICITQNDHAGYYPGAEPMFLKLIFSMDGERIHGAQIIGGSGVDKRIDTLSTAIRLGAGVEELEVLDFAYSPPYSSAKDPVNMAGFTAKNVIDGLVEFCSWDEKPDGSSIWLDIREKAEVHSFALPGALHIPAGQLRESLGELDKSKEYIVFCTIGVRAYNAARAMMQRGFENVKVYPAGVRLYRALFGMAHGGTYSFFEAEPDKRIDCSGLGCPAPVSELIPAMDSMKTGEILEVVLSSTEAEKEAAGWCLQSGNILLGCRRTENEIKLYIKKHERYGL